MTKLEALDLSRDFDEGTLADFIVVNVRTGEIVFNTTTQNDTIYSSADANDLH